MTFEEINRPKSVPCARCGNASEVEVWGHRICFSCHSAWMSDDRFGSGSINASLRLSDRVEDFTTANHERYCAEAKKRTAAWVKVKP